MTKMETSKHFSRRSILKAGGALVVSVGMPIGLDSVLAINQAFAQGTRPPLVPDQLSSYIAINADGSVSAFFGKMDMGQGLTSRSDRSWRKSSTCRSRRSTCSWPTPAPA